MLLSVAVTVGPRGPLVKLKTLTLAEPQVTVTSLLFLIGTTVHGFGSAESGPLGLVQATAVHNTFPVSPPGPF